MINTNTKLPEIGKPAQRKIDGDTWINTEISGHSPDGNFAAYFDPLGMGWAPPENLRQVDIPETAVDQDRENTVAEMLAVMESVPGGLTDGLRALYDANYRKQAS